MEIITYRPIGIIRSGHTKPEDVPIQPVFAAGCKGRVEIFSEYAEGLHDLEGFSHLYLIYHFHRAGPMKLRVKPFMDTMERGLFATRAPVRPNAIGLSIVALTGFEGLVLHLDGVDILDGTPLLDIKPYTARFDCIQDTRNGWQDAIRDEDAAVRGLRNFRPGTEK
jgi:tRNA-Thr(GGU) m(6)t(6)A37 methyltransferase TsaA